MEDVEASEQANRWEGSDLSAFPTQPNPVIYDLSGAREYILRPETAKDISDVVSMEFLQKPRDYVTLVKDAKGKVLYKIEGNEALAFQCDACLKNFTTKQSLERHKDRFPLCKAWIGTTDAVLSESVYTWALKKVDEAISEENNPKMCRFCKKEFSNVGNFHKHFESSIICNRLGLKEIRKTFKA